MVEQKRRFSLTNLFRRSTPKPADRTVFNMGIQERETHHMKCSVQVMKDMILKMLLNGDSEGLITDRSPAIIQGV